MNGNIEDRLDQVESRFAMLDLVSDYCHGFDKHDWERFLGIWWDDCVWEIGPPFGDFKGHNGIREAVKEILWPAWRKSTNGGPISQTQSSHHMPKKRSQSCLSNPWQ